jgi:hypothetical protein
MAKEFNKLDAQAKAVAKERDALKPKIVDAMKRAKSRLIEVGNVRVVLVQQESTVYDEDNIYTSLTPKQRRLAFDQYLELSELSSSRRRELQAQLRDLLTPSERRRCVKWRFNLDRMSQAVQAGDIPIEVLDENTSIVPKAPYPNVTIK